MEFRVLRGGSGSERFDMAVPIIPIKDPSQRRDFGTKEAFFYGYFTTYRWLGRITDSKIDDLFMYQFYYVLLLFVSKLERCDMRDS